MEMIIKLEEVEMVDYNNRFDAQSYLNSGVFIVRDKLNSSASVFCVNKVKNFAYFVSELSDLVEADLITSSKEPEVKQTEGISPDFVLELSRILTREKDR